MSPFMLAAALGMFSGVFGTVLAANVLAIPLMLSLTVHWSYILLLPMAFPAATLITVYALKIVDWTDTIL